MRIYLSSGDFIHVFMCMSQLLTQAAVSQTMNTQLKIADTYSIQDDPGEMSWFAASFL